MTLKQIKTIVKTWLKNHDHSATHYKLWYNGIATCYKFQACIGQESYGEIFTISVNGKIDQA